MSDRLGPLAFGTKEELVFLGRDLGEQRNYSEDVAKEIDEEIHHLVDNALQLARRTLRANEEVLRTLARRLIEVETMDVAKDAAHHRRGRGRPRSPPIRPGPGPARHRLDVLSTHEDPS